MDATNIPDHFIVDVPPDRARNTFIFSEKKRTWGGSDGPPHKRKREKGWSISTYSLIAQLTARVRQTNPSPPPAPCQSPARSSRPTSQEREIPAHPTPASTRIRTIPPPHHSTRTNGSVKRSPEPARIRFCKCLIAVRQGSRRRRVDFQARREARQARARRAHRQDILAVQ